MTLVTSAYVSTRSTAIRTLHRPVQRGKARMARSAPEHHRRYQAREATQGVEARMERADHPRDESHLEGPRSGWKGLVGYSGASRSPLPVDRHSGEGRSPPPRYQSPRRRPQSPPYPHRPNAIPPGAWGTPAFAGVTASRESPHKTTDNAAHSTFSPCRFQESRSADAPPPSPRSGRIPAMRMPRPSGWSTSSSCRRSTRWGYWRG